MTDLKSEASPVQPAPPPLLPPHRKRQPIRWIMGSGLVGVVGLGGWWAYQVYFHKPSPPVAVTLLPIERGTVEITVTESGTVEFGGQQTLKSPREVTVEQVAVQEGDRVKKGQPMITLRDRSVQDSLKDQQIENTKSGLDLMRRKEKVAEAQTKVNAATVRLKDSQDLLNKGFISETDLQLDQEKLDAADSELRDAQIEQLKAELDVRKGQEKIAGIRQQFSDLLVVAPINGVVMKLDVKSGDGIKTESNLITLGDPSQELIKMQLSTLNAAKVRINQPARISTIGPEAKVFTGRIISLSPQATAPQSGGGLGGGDGGEQAKVDTKVVLDRPSQTLIPGSLVSVEIITEQRRDVVTIPPEAVQLGETGSFVWMKDAQNRARQQPVELGLQGLQQIEVKTGLNQGDQIVLAPPTAPLTPGTLLQVGGPDEQPSELPSQGQPE